MSRVASSPRRLPRSLAPALLAVAVMAAIPVAGAQQRGRAQQDIGQTVAERTSAHYRFQRFVVSSPDGTRTWRINLGVPEGPAPAGGFPAFWMLDGNAALQVFDDALLDELASATPQVLVFVGYDNQQRVDTEARTRDYTPSATTRGEGDALERVGGGAAAFLQAIEHQIRPEVARRAPIDPQRQALWGHSFGGLFVLQALYSGQANFQTYAPASPSLWWDHGMMLGAPEQQFVAGNAGRAARVLLMLGGAERHPDNSNRNMANPRVASHLMRVADAPPGAAFDLSERLRQVSGLQVEYREFEGLSHGPTLPASLLYALHAVAGIADHSGRIAP
ncbi:alpha/beta hydrolase-fold protein [Pseudoxanthomonas sp.]|uniref:alpha/beta hydrolase n=1 Tax=Pseudoxanthomonas sp. TaxID=1871049 RepID=UPI002601A285|nr:alpha/beta hydrolase-fold protein [Pseudoxanthomonas sp.]WDS37903.1 MAG: alpha/beta hydrolase-fold protein [Pseudoxanthomonas sp.]